MLRGREHLYALRTETKGACSMPPLFSIDGRKPNALHQQAQYISQPPCYQKQVATPLSQTKSKINILSGQGLRLPNIASNALPRSAISKWQLIYQRLNISILDRKPLLMTLTRFAPLLKFNSAALPFIRTFLPEILISAGVINTPLISRLS
jgi:hypothetical protein